MEIIDCPTCGAPAEVETWSRLGSSSGPVEHVRLRCVQQHWYLLPRDMIVASAPADEAAAARQCTAEVSPIEPAAQP